MNRLVSFGVLLGLVVLFGVLSLRVMASFLLPMLMAAMLVVIFGPLHRWIRDRTRWPDWAAAGLSTLLVVLIVLVPVSLLIFRAGGEAFAILRRPEGFVPVSSSEFQAQQCGHLPSHFALVPPHARQV